MMELDCSVGEGGGSIVRISVAIAASKNFPIKLVNIRKKRSNPGLQAQHIEAINALRQLSGIKTVGLSKGSLTLTIYPEEKKSTFANVTIPTAGNVTLVAQAVLYYALTQKEDITLKIRGGATHAKWAPSVDYVTNVTYKLLDLIGKNVRVKINKYGFYPKGGADCEFIYKKSANLNPLELVEKGELESIEIFSIASFNLKKRNVAERQVDSFLRNLNLKVEPKISIKYVSTHSPGSGITVVNKYDSGAATGCFVVGDVRLSSESVGKICKNNWLKINETLAPVDEFAADQLIVPLALTEGQSKFRTYKITSHTKTNIFLVKKLLRRRIDIEKENNTYLIMIR